MERDHKAVNEKALALVKKLGVTPEDNDTSKALSKQAADKRAELAKLNGKAFDKSFDGCVLKCGKNLVSLSEIEWSALFQENSVDEATADDPYNR
jgi:predicted outer membrane protein